VILGMTMPDSCDRILETNRLCLLARRGLCKQ
jgi:hypothetical protein